MRIYQVQPEWVHRCQQLLIRGSRYNQLPKGGRQLRNLNIFKRGARGSFSTYVRKMPAINRRSHHTTCCRAILSQASHVSIISMNSFKPALLAPTYFCLCLVVNCARPLFPTDFASQHTQPSLSAAIDSQMQERMQAYSQVAEEVCFFTQRMSRNVPRKAAH